MNNIKLFPLVTCIITLGLLFCFFQCDCSQAPHNIIEGYEYVDMGLSVKWASMNIGASSPEEEGKYYAWGETKAHLEPVDSYPNSWHGIKNKEYLSQKRKKIFTWSSYKWAYKYDNLIKCRISKYCFYDNLGDVDSLTKLQPIDDAANVNWGGLWRMPTKEEYEELQENCTYEWIDNYKNSHKSGWLLSSKVEGYSDKTLFFPVNEEVCYDSISCGKGGSLIWLSTNSLFEERAFCGRISKLGNGPADEMSIIVFDKCYGCAIRPVHP